MPIERTWLEPCYSKRLVSPFLQHLVRQGNENGLVRELSALDVDARIPIRSMLSLLGAYESETGREDLGVAAAQRMPNGGGGLAHYVAASAPTVGAALQAMVRYVPLLNEAAQLHLRVQDGVAHLHLGSSVLLPPSASDFQTVVMWRAIAHWTGRTTGYEAWFQHKAPQSVSAHAAALPSVVLRFGAAADAIIFDARLLALPMTTADAELHAVLVRKADEELSRIPVVKTLSQRVRSVLLTELHASYVDCAWVSAKLGMSRRSLSRHLELEQTSYTEILNNVRRDVARHLLRRTEINIQEVASRLGYSQTGAFTRAFRRWEGKSPLAYRHSAGPASDQRAEELFRRVGVGVHAAQ